MAAMESLVSGFVCGMGYGFFSGQPLTILGSTGDSICLLIRTCFSPIIYFRTGSGVRNDSVRFLFESRMELFEFSFLDRHLDCYYFVHFGSN